MPTFKIDLHCHSKASDNPPLWFMQRIGCPESFTEPADLYNIARQRGMDLVTITDHDTIAGVREIAHLEDVIVGCEVTTFFPDDVKVHVLCFGLDDNSFGWIEKHRHDIYELVDFLNREGIVHVCAHPLHQVNGKLTWEHFEQLILLFKRFEALNGSRLRQLNSVQEDVLRTLTPEQIEHLSAKHGIAPVGDRPWEKSFTGGSDDHSGLFVGTCYTEIEANDSTPRSILNAIQEGYITPGGASDGSLTLSHQVNSIAYQYYRHKISRESKDVLTVLGRVFERTRHELQGPQSGIRKAIKKIYKVFRKPKTSGIDLIDELQEGLANNQAIKNLFHEGMMSREEFNDNVFQFSADVLDEMILRVIQKPRFLPWFAAFAPTVTASYILCAKNLHQERRLIDRAHQWLGTRREPKVAWFSDSVINMDGVSKTCRVFTDAAQRREQNLTLITSTSQPLPEGLPVENFAPIREIPTPGYENVTLGLPSLLRVLRYVEEQEFDSIVVSTPGPIGLMGLLCGKLMNLPVHGIYHTDLPRIALRVSGDPMFGELALTLTRLFYNHVDRVLVPSNWYRDDLQKMAVPDEQIDIMERWVDHEVFSPAHRDEAYWDAREPMRLLFVGRISKDKNLDLLMQAYEELAPKYDNFVVHVVGDGPYATEMAQRSRNWSRFVMTGAKHGEDLSKAFASSDVFVYPGLLDTFGNVIIEAQASGLPCVVMNEGGPPELIEPGQTGLIGRTSGEFIQHIEKLITDETTRRSMSERASVHARERFNEDRVFDEFWRNVTRSDTDYKPRVRHQFVFDHQPRNVVSLSA